MFSFFLFSKTGNPKTPPVAALSSAGACGEGRAVCEGLGETVRKARGESSSFGFEGVFWHLF